ncbi:GGDEF domain-containing protein [Thalassotalea hakodatensis]|uniref:GGDEF domain-containing protein n=1 Tax=Thalassotalea hakodatensis TaxID=3030492 RepID=UPI0025737C9D|nr:GGDEF domain-containing protein [Thalassotalea hakodatensis]
MNNLHSYYLLLLFFFSTNIEASQQEPSESKLLTQQQTLPVDDRIIDLVEKVRKKEGDITTIFQRLQSQESTFNIAEKYLMLMISAYIHKQEGALALSVTELTQALSFEERMDTAQLNTENFSHIHLLLAEIYQIQGQYKLAYDEKKHYLEKRKKNRSVLQKIRLASLNEKYATDLKIKENELLENEQKLKSLQLAEATKRRESQQRNLAILMVTALIILVLLIRQLKIRATLKYLAKTDSLTGLYNRRVLFTQGVLLLQEHQQRQIPLSVMMLDIDHFKYINDTYGHDVGDKVIIAVANLGKETLRAKDIFSRIGGEEYAIILPHTELKEAKAIAERLREKVQQHVFELEDKATENFNVTISIGVATLSSENTDFDQLLHAADEAMYRAKTSGRNQVCQ